MRDDPETANGLWTRRWSIEKSAGKCLANCGGPRDKCRCDAALGTTPDVMRKPMLALLEANKVKKQGVQRGTKYFAK